MTQSIGLFLGGLLMGGTALGLAVLLSLTRDRGRTAAFVFTAIILLIAAGETADRFGLFGRWAILDLVLVPLLRASVFVLPPVVYVYVCTRIAPHRKGSVWLYLPAFLVFSVFLIMEGTGRVGSVLPQIFWITFVGFCAACIAMIAHLLRGHVVSLKSLFSSMPSGSLARLRRFWLIVWLPVLSIGAELILSRMSAATEPVMLAGATMRVFCVLTIIFLLVVEQIAAPEPKEVFAAQARYQNSSLARDVVASLADDMRNHMARTLAHRDPLLSLSALARQLRLPEHHVSQVLNQEIGKNFYDFVNGYRVAEARHLLVTTDTSVLEIALEVGFNSRSTFYDAYRKNYGQTPTESRRKGAT
ncbi:helix-turn-helix transcriptional regulator [Rhizobium sp. WL3]|uniref:helix-turn-helix domain-containing protein n=1 Tax=Rhizobium sp. WL3 TaxID=2603277 RepID=UPI00164FC00A|nr:helix-turn-helix transcriptional regulator [Rhizobium sp. WL3]